MGNTFAERLKKPRACLGNGGIKWMEDDCRGFWEILTYSGNSSTPIPFIPIHSTKSQISPQGRYFPTRILREFWLG
jgi:hypothetical protein